MHEKALHDEILMVGKYNPVEQALGQLRDLGLDPSDVVRASGRGPILMIGVGLDGLHQDDALRDSVIAIDEDPGRCLRARLIAYLASIFRIHAEDILLQNGWDEHFVPPTLDMLECPRTVVTFVIRTCRDVLNLDLSPLRQYMMALITFPKHARPLQMPVERVHDKYGDDTFGMALSYGGPPLINPTREGVQSVLRAILSSLRPGSELRCAPGCLPFSVFSETHDIHPNPHGDAALRTRDVLEYTSDQIMPGTTVEVETISGGNRLPWHRYTIRKPQ